MSGALAHILPEVADADLAKHDAAYTAWLQNEVAEAEADLAPLVSHEEVLEGWEQIISRAEARKKATQQ